MSVTKCERLREGQHAEIRVPFDHNYTLQWRITTNDDTDGPLTVFDGSQTASPNPLPYKLAIYAPPYSSGDSDVNTKAMEFTLEQEEKKLKFWIATVRFRPPAPGEPEDPEDIPENPLDRPIKVWFEYIQFNDDQPTDKDGSPIVNKAGQPYPEKVILTDYRTVFVIRRNVAALVDIWDLNETYRRTVNSDEFEGQAAGTLRYQHTQGTQPRTENGVEYYEATTRVEYRSEGWDVSKIEEGWKLVNDPDNDDFSLVTPMDADGVPLAEPSLMREDGAWLIPGLPPILTDWEIYTPVAYAPLIAP